MAIALDNSTRVYGLAVSSLTSPSWAVGGSDRLLIHAVLTSAYSPSNPSSTKWGGSGGTSLTLIGGTHLNVGTYRRMSLYYLTAPTAQTSTSYVSWASSQDEVGMMCINYTGVDQSDPLHSIAKVTARGSYLPTTEASDWFNTTNQPICLVTANTASGDTVVGYGFCSPDTANTGLAITTSSGKGTQRIKIDGSDLSGYHHLALSDAEATGSTFQFGWELRSMEDTVHWGAIGITLKPAAAAGNWPLLQMKNQLAYNDRMYSNA